MQYKQYLKTAHWLLVKKAALERAGGKCQICGSPQKLGVHHNNYGCLWSEATEDVIVLCEKCHAKHHDELPSAPQRMRKDRRDYHFWPTLRMADGRAVNTRLAVKPEFDALH